MKRFGFGGLKVGSGPGGGASWRNGASGVSRPGTVDAVAPLLALGGAATGGAVVLLVADAVVAGGGADAQANDKRQSQARRMEADAGGRHFLIRPMIGASGFGSMVTTTRASFFRYCCATRWMAAASTAR